LRRSRIVRFLRGAGGAPSITYTSSGRGLSVGQGVAERDGEVVVDEIRSNVASSRRGSATAGPLFSPQ
jgi:hypothetical protein